MSRIPGQPEIEFAAERIGPHIRETPTIAAGEGAFGLGDVDLQLKLELFQHAGSFKTRGATTYALNHNIPDAGLAAASGGNHGVAVAHVARALGHRCEIFVPEICSPAKQAALASSGATVVVGGSVFQEAQDACAARTVETGALQIHPYESAEMLAGAGTCAREFEQQARGLDTALVAVGGGGFIGGVASWFGNSTRVIAVEPETSSCLHQARAAGEPVDVSVSGVAADSLGATRIGTLAWEATERYVDDSVTVPNDAITDAQRRLWQELRIAAEPGGATALAALIAGAFTPAPGERVGVFVCGGNVDPTTLTS